MVVVIPVAKKAAHQRLADGALEFFIGLALLYQNNS